MELDFEVDKINYVFMHLVENAPNNIGKGKKYLGVCGNLTAFGCKLSMEEENGMYNFDTKEEVSREIAEYRTTHPKPPAREAVLV